jgi:hypothetical protein
VRGAGAEQVGRLLRKVLRALRAHQHIAPPPSVTRQLSRTVSGSLTIREPSTSSIVSGSRENASGLSCAHFARGNRDFRELLARGPVLMHVSRAASA